MSERSIAQDHGRDAARAVENTAKHLEQVAERLRLLAPALERGDGRASRVAADIVNDYTQGVGSAGSRLWTLLTDAADADAAFRSESSGEV